jgi:large subunit ribosomal protein L24
MTHSILLIGKSCYCVQIIAGHDKGKVGTITKVLTTTGEVVVEGVNIKTKHVAPKVENEAGQIKKYEFPVHHSNGEHV